MTSVGRARDVRSSHCCNLRLWATPSCTWVLPTVSAAKLKQSVASVRPSVCPSVRLFPLYRLNWLTSELECVCVWVMTIARLRLKIKVIRQGQRSMFSAYGRGNAVKRSVWPRSSTEDSFIYLTEKIRLPFKLSLLRGSRPKSDRPDPQHLAHNIPNFIHRPIGSLLAEL